MRRFFVIAWLAAGALGTGTLAAQRVAPPATRTDVAVDTVHGVAIADPYRWLEQQQAPETRVWLEAQNRHTDSVVATLPGRERIQRRLTELMKIETVGLPSVRGNRYFFSKRRADQELSVLYVRKGPNAPDEVLVDPHDLSSDRTVSVNFMGLSRDGRLIGYAVRAGGEDEVSVRFLDVDTRSHLADTLPRARYSGVSITPDKRGVYYSKQTPRGPRVFYHAMGTDPAGDSTIFGDGYGPEKIIGASLTLGGRFLIISVSHGSAARKSELYVQDLERRAPIVPLVNDVEARFGTVQAGDSLFLVTNWNAPKNRVLLVDLHDPSRAKWREVVPERGSVIQSATAAAGKLLVTYLENVQPRVRIFDPSGTLVREMPLPGIGSMPGLTGTWDHGEVFYTFSSLAEPPTGYRYDVASGRRQVWARLAVPVKSDSVEVRQVWYRSKDGTRVPMFVAHRKGLKLDGRNPTLLTGYGGFNASQQPSFSQRAAFWIESGGVYALPSLRGGGEFGEAWHRAGMLDRKQAVFDDFIGAAEWLVSNRYTSPAKLAISGGSNGGLLVGAAMTQRPELFRAVVCTYPLLDMVRYHRFLVAGYWVPEYGSADDARQFRYLHAYSPYHRVRDGERYPAVLFVSGDADTRVDPLHARKMTARVQAATASDRPVLLRYHIKAGHSGGRPLGQVISDLTEEMLFLFWQLGVSGERVAATGG